MIKSTDNEVGFKMELIIKNKNKMNKLGEQNLEEQKAATENKTTKIDKLINQLSNCFIKKIINNDYEFVQCDEHYAEILIDKKYTARFWIWNIQLDNYDFGNNFDLDVIKDVKFKNEKQRLKAWSYLEKHIESYTETFIVEQKKEKIKELKKELKTLTNKK